MRPTVTAPKIDPSRDYFSELDAMYPPWARPPTVKHDSAPGAALTMDSEPAGTREFRLANGAIFVMPHQQYVRGVDPAGNIGHITVKTSRVPEDDETGFWDKILANKRRAGWLIAERDQELNGMVGQEYGAYVVAEMHRRRAAKAEQEKLDAEAYESQASRRAAESAQQMSDAVTAMATSQRSDMKELAKELATAIVQAQQVAAQQKAPR